MLCRAAFHVALTCLLLQATPLCAQPRPIRPGAGPGAAVLKAADASGAKDPAEQWFPGGATLKTEPEHERLLKRADQCLTEGRPDLAAVLWQKVLDEAGETLSLARIMEPVGPTSSPLAIYNSISQRVEQALVKSPPAALESYRTSADAEARALLAAAGIQGEERALEQVVRRFFVSSIGDDAAYKLACLALDRHDFVGANRLLNKLLTSHPDPSISRAEIWLRLAVASAHMHDRKSAEQALTQFAASGDARPGAELVDFVMSDIKATLAQPAATDSGTDNDWTMSLGVATRTGHMPPLPAVATNRTLSELWVRELPIAATTPTSGGPQRGGLPANDPFAAPVGMPAVAAAASREELIAQWRAGAWRPTGRLLFHDGRIFLKSPDRLLCFGAAGLTEEPIWQSAWENHYEMDGATQQMAMLAMSMGQGFPTQAAKTPKTPAEVFFFGDRVHQSMAIDGDVVYSLEGKRPQAAKPNQQVNRGPQWGAVPRRVRRNWLSAYHTNGGKALWTRSASDDDKEGATEVGFLSAPTPCRDLLLAPVTDGGTIWLLGLEQATGKTAWKTYLCDEPPSGALPWAEPLIAADGNEAYVACGCGVIFAVDAAAGGLRWAVRYARDGKPNAALQNAYGRNVRPALDLSGWDDDVVIPHGRLLVVMPSDSDRLLAIDRRSGERVWESPRISPLGSVANYCLGVHGESLYVAGKNVVRRYDIPSGRLLKEWETDDSFGRGCLTSDAVYVPIKDSILKLDLELKRALSQVGVALASDEPIGNLFSDGEKLWVVGAGSVYAMTTLEHRLAILAEQIAAGNAQAQLNRMRLHFKQKRDELALADLRGAYSLFRAQFSADEAAQRLCVAMSDQKLPQTQPLMSLRLLNELFVTADSQPELSREASARRSDVLATAINNIRHDRPAGSTQAILDAAVLLNEEYLLISAALALDAAAKEGDVARLMEALERGPPAAQLISIRAATRLSPAQAKSPLVRMLSAPDDRVRLGAARALANLGERANVLETLVQLLESSQVAVRSRSHQSLQSLTSQRIPFAVEGTAADRAASIQSWKQWIIDNGASAKLTLPLEDRTVPLGRTLVVSRGALIELDADRKEQWKMQLPGAAWGCQGLSNGNRLVAINSHAMVIEYDSGGKEVWRKDRLPAPPTSVQRLDSGSTLVACSNVHQVVEIALDGSIIVIPVAGRPVSAQRLENGNTLVALQETQRVVEVNGAGKILWEARTGGHPPSHAVRLENGNTLVTLTQARKVVEYDPTGRTIVWNTQSPLVNPQVAQRLANGNTLVGDSSGVQEFDATGKPVPWRHRQQQVTGLSSF